MKKIICLLFGHKADEPIYEGILGVDQYHCNRCDTVYWQHPLMPRVQIDDDDPRLRRDLR